MPKAFVWILVAVTVAVLALFGLAIGIAVVTREPDSGSAGHGSRGRHRDGLRRPRPNPSREPEPVGDKRCWKTFGGDPRRSLARPEAALGLPAKRFYWSHGLGNVHRVPARVLRRATSTSTASPARHSLFDAETGKIQWARRVGGKAAFEPRYRRPADPRRLAGLEPSRPSSRSTGRQLWRNAPRARSSRRRWSSTARLTSARTTGARSPSTRRPDASAGRTEHSGRINASASVFGGQVCVTTYAGSFVCLDRRTGEERWTTYLKRDVFRYESFYASPSLRRGHVSTSVSRSGRASLHSTPRTGHVVWRRRRRRARIHDAGGPRRDACSPAASTGASGHSAQRPARSSGARRPGAGLLGAPVVIGPYVFVSTFEKRTVALRVEDGSLAWRIPLGKYAPGIATERTYFLSLNGRLIATPGRDVPRSLR